MAQWRTLPYDQPVQDSYWRELQALRDRQVVVRMVWLMGGSLAILIHLLLPN